MYTGWLKDIFEMKYCICIKKYVYIENESCGEQFLNIRFKARKRNLNEVYLNEALYLW